METREVTMAGWLGCTQHELSSFHFIEAGGRGEGWGAGGEGGAEICDHTRTWCPIGEM